MTFDRIFAPDDLLDAVSDAAWLQAMLDFEAALAAAEAQAGVIPAEAAAAIADDCRTERFDRAQLVPGARSAGNPAEPMVKALRGLVGGEAATWVHFGATSQDVMDTAAMLVTRRARSLVDRELDGVTAACARLADEHRTTVMAARTLLQQAVPTTFGLKAAGWLVSVLEAQRAVAAWQPVVELGGAAGTLAALGDKGLEVLGLLAQELELAEPVLPWHTNRVRFGHLGARLAVAASVLAKIGRDVALQSQTEVAEVREPPGKGGSSTMPHKRNPVDSALAVACAEQARASASTLASAVVQEHERGLGGGQAEWGALSQALVATGGAAAHVRAVLDGLEVDVGRMRTNLNELTAAEHASFVLAERVGRERAHELVADAARSESFRDGLLVAGLSAGEVERVLDPETYLGAADALVDRALAFYREEP